MTYNPRTGTFTQPRHPADVLAEIEHEIQMRDLGRTPDLYPDIADLEPIRLRAYEANLAAARASWNTPDED